jgi:serine phosphatase RsbU (regulator of sigma subunit)
MAFHSIIIQQDTVRMSPGQILTLVNRIMNRDFDLFGMFMTAFIGKINIAESTLEYASAGHCQPVYYTPGGGVELLETVDFMLGVDQNIEYADLKTVFNPETKLLVYSDGLTDIMDEHGEMVGVEPRAKACEIEFRKNSISDSCEKIYKAVLQISSGTLQDDVSMIGIERLKESG